MDARVGVKASDETWWWSWSWVELMAGASTDPFRMPLSPTSKMLSRQSHRKSRREKGLNFAVCEIWSLAHLHPHFFTWNLQQWLPKRMSYIGSCEILDMFWRLSPTSLVSLIDIDTFQFHTSGRTLGTALGAWTSIHGGPHKGRSKEDGKINLLHPVHPLKLNMKLRFKMGPLERGDTKNGRCQVPCWTLRCRSGALRKVFSFQSVL